MNPLNMKTNMIRITEAKVAVTIVWKKAAKNRNKDIDEKCTPESRTSWRKNLKNAAEDYGHRL